MKSFFLKRLVFAFILSLLSFHFVWGHTFCSCGSFASGVVNYSVAGADCCDDSPVGYGTMLYYEQQNNGVWQLTGMDLIDGREAQGECCALG